MPSVDRLECLGGMLLTRHLPLVTLKLETGLEPPGRSAKMQVTRLSQ